jgi:predicted transcriptional regulator
MCVGSRRDSLEIVGDISSFLKKNQGIAISPTHIATKTHLNYQSCKEYLRLITFAQEMPKLNTIKKNNGVLYVLEKDLTEYPEETQKKILKEEYEMEIDESDKLYIGLLEKEAVNESKAIKLEPNRQIKEGLKFRHLKKTKNEKVYLTALGQTIAKGAKKLFS